MSWFVNPLGELARPSASSTQTTKIEEILCYSSTMDIESYSYKEKLWTPNPTNSDENSFFHSVFGVKSNQGEIYADGRVRVRRKEWSAFLSRFETEPVPPSLANVLKDCFSAHAKYRDLSLEDKTNLANYADDVMSEEHIVTVEEVYVLATLNNLRVVVFRDQPTKPLEIGPNAELLGSYQKDPGKLTVAVLLLKDNVFTRLDPVDEENVVASASYSTTHEKGACAGSKSLEFHLDILAVISLRAHRDLSDWKLSAINKKAGAFADAVLEYPEGTILVQAKHKEDEMEKITTEDLFSDNPKSDEFSLPKFFLSYHTEIKKNFDPIKNVIICTNRGIDVDGRFLKIQWISPTDLLYHGADDYSFLTFGEEALPILKEKVESYLDKKKKGKAPDKIIINDKNLKDFLQRLQFYPNYPTGSELRKVIERSLPRTNLQCHTYLDFIGEVKKWIKLRNGMYLNKPYVNAMLLEIQRDKYWQELDKHNVHFQNNILEYNEKATIIDIKDASESFLQELKIYRALKYERKKVLYINSDDELAVQKQVIDAFELDQYTFLIVIWSKDTDFPHEMLDKLNIILAKRTYKKVIFVSEYSDKFITQMGFCATNYKLVRGCVTFKDLSKDTQEMLLEKKNIIFQGIDVSMEQLITTQIIEDYEDAFNPGLLEKLVRGENIEVGKPLSGLDERMTRLYIDRQFMRDVKEDCWGCRYEKTFGEDNIVAMNAKLILITDGAGRGKSTVLTNLAVSTKNRYPKLWVNRIELNNQKNIEILEKHHRNKSEKLTVLKLITSNNENQLENYVFSLPKKIVLMLDGLDEVNSDYSDLIVDLIKDCKEAPNFAKILITIRPHTFEKLKNLDAQTLMLKPFTEKNQIKFLTNWWMHSLQLEDTRKKKCEQFAKALINKMHIWIKANEQGECDFAEVPLQARMLAEVFQESNQWDESMDWKGCKEYLNANEEEPRLPEKMDINKLFEMFFNKKLEVFKAKANLEKNAYANNLFKMDECLSCHENLALKVIFGEEKRKVFSNYREIDDNEEKSMIDMGIVQKIGNEVQFVHRTFAEYFVCRSLIKELQLNKRSERLRNLFFQDILKNDDLKFVRSLFSSSLENQVVPSTSANFQNLQFLLRDRHLSKIESNNFTFMHLLAEEGHVEILRFLCQDINTTNKVNIKDERGRTPLYYASKHNHLAMAQLLVDRGADVNVHQGIHSSPLAVAVRDGHFEMVEYLMRQKADIKVKGRAGYYLLYEAVIRKYREIAEYLLNHILDSGNFNMDITSAYTAAYLGRSGTLKDMVEQGLDVNSRTETGESLIFGATRGRQLGIIEYLKKQGVEIGGKDKYGNTALHVASLDSSLASAVDLLIKLGIDVNVQNGFGETALHKAVKHGTLNIVKLLVESCSESVAVDATDEDGCTALYIAASWDNLDAFMYLVKNDANFNIAGKGGSTLLHSFASKGNLNIVEYLVNHGVNVNSANDTGETALHEASSLGHPDIVRFLIQRGANTSVKNNRGCTALHLAAEGGHLDTVELLVEHGRAVNVKDKGEWTALHYASSEGHLNVVQFLVQCQADVNIKDRDGRMALHYAAAGGHFDTAKFLVESGADKNGKSNISYTALHDAASEGRLDIVKHLVTCGVEVDSKDCEDHTPLHEAVLGGHLDVVKLLVLYGADVKIASNNGRTVLHHASAMGSLETVKFLVGNDAGLNSRDKKGRTALHEATWEGHLDTVELLVQCGEDVNMVDKNGRTVLHYASVWGRLDIVKFLVDNGANLNTKCREGRTGLHEAAAGGHFSIVKFLAERQADVTIKDNCHRTAQQYAELRGHTNAVKFLKKWKKASTNKWKPWRFVKKLGVKLSKFFGRDDVNRGTRYAS